MARARPARFGRALSLSPALDDSILARLHLDRRRQCPRGDVLGDFVQPDRRRVDAAACRDVRVGAGRAPTGDAIREIGLLLIAPLVAGQFLRPWIGGFVLRHKAILSATDRGSILLVVYGAFGHAVSAGLWRALPISGFAIMIVIEALILAFMLFATRYAAKTLGFNREDTIAIVFCGSKKSLAAGVPMAGVLFPAPTSA